MSTYQFQTATGEVVNMGYDPALHRFFMVVENEMTQEEFNDEETHDSEFDDPKSEFAYSNLDDKRLDANPALYQDLDYFKDKAKELGLEVPAKIWEKMQKDHDDQN